MRIVLAIALILTLSCAHPAAPQVDYAWPVLASVPVPATYQWVSPLSGASYGLIALGSGIVYEAHCTVQAIGANPVYVFFIDTSFSSRPIVGAHAINGGVSGGMVAAGDAVLWQDQTNAALTFIHGLVLAASTTPDKYTCPNYSDGSCIGVDPVNLRCDVKLRSTTP